MPADPAASKTPSFVSDAALVFVLGGFAVAQPLYDLLGNNPTFFVAHDFDGTDVVVFALALLLIPAAALLALLTASRLIGPMPHQVLRAVFAGFFITLTLLPPLERSIGLSTTAWLALLVVLTAALAVAFWNLRHLRTFLTYLTPAPLLFLIVFLLFTPTRSLVFASDPAAAAVELQGTRTPVVVIAFDEFPLGVLLDEHGAIDATRYPGFARLAALSTWYPNATSVSPYTQLAVPAIETGVRPVGNPVPVATNHPRSLFTLFARSHELHVTEAMTRVCPRELCRRSTAEVKTKEADFNTDARAVYWHTLLPEDTADDWGVPTIENRWAGFDDEPTPTPTPKGKRSKLTGTEFFRQAAKDVDSQDQRARWDAMLATIEPSTKPGLWFHHSVLPHTPYEWLPGGVRYNGRGTPASPFLYWPSDPEVVEVGVQRFVLQVMYVDQLVDQLLTRLEHTGMLDDAMLVITADHGTSFIPGANIRAFNTQDGRDGVWPVPLFVKYPGQQTGDVDSRDASTIDILPTISDALGVDVPKDWKFDGRSLRAQKAPTRPLLAVTDPDASVPTKIDGPLDARSIAAHLRQFLVTTGDPSDPYRVGPYGALVHRSLDELTVRSSTGTVRADAWSAYDNFDPNGALVPAMFEATVTGTEPNRWVAISVNGRIAGVGPVYELDGRLRVVALLDPSLLRAGANALTVHVVDPDGSTLHTLTPQR